VRRIVFVTQQVDPGHPALAATVGKIAALAARVDEVIVLADGAVAGALPANCRFEPFRAPTKAGRGLRFERALARELRRRPRPQAVIAHMCPIYAVLAAPLARPLRVPVVLWFTHWRASGLLRLAERLSTAVVTVDRRSLPVESAKMTPIGHGIDMTEFTCPEPHGGTAALRAVALGRYTAIKGLDVVLRAVELAAVPVELDLYGPALTPAEHAERARLAGLAGPRTTLHDAVPRSEVPALLARADVMVSNVVPGAADKVVYEAAASCLPVLGSNPVFDDLLDEPLRFDRDDPASLARRLEELAALGPDGRARLGRELRDRVVSRHSVENWADRILEVAAR
jgi:glycosyltransferase involved in cell wall biosynthesis